MDLVKQYVKKRGGQYITSIVLAIAGVVANLFSYVYMAKIIIALIDGIKSTDFYLSTCMMILLMFLIKEISAGISSAISCLLYTSRCV